MFIIVVTKLVRRKFTAMAIFPFILLRSKQYKSDLMILNHEKIHLKQQLELLWFPFFIWYILEFFVRWIQFKDRDKAYRNISFEREAYSNEKDMRFLKKRKIWNFLNYL